MIVFLDMPAEDGLDYLEIQVLILQIRSWVLGNNRVYSVDFSSRVEQFR